MNIWSRPSLEADFATTPDPGTTMALLKLLLTLFTLTTSAAILRSYNLELVQEPIKTRFSFISSGFIPSTGPISNAKSIKLSSN